MVKSLASRISHSGGGSDASLPLIAVGASWEDGALGPSPHGSTDAGWGETNLAAAATTSWQSNWHCHGF